MKEMLSNKILTGLPGEEFARLVPFLEPVSLSAGQRLAEAGEPASHVYFPESAVLSWHADMQEGKSAEVGMVGRDGMAELGAVLGARPAAQSLGVTAAGSALRMRTEDFERELRGAAALRRSLLRYAGEYLAQVSQRGACAVLHRMEQRFAVWLLLLIDRLDADAVEITQERIAQHLGVRRAGVTVIAMELQKRGAISYTRGNLRVVGRRKLEAVSCECYGALGEAKRQTAPV